MLTDQLRQRERDHTTDERAISAQEAKISELEAKVSHHWEEIVSWDNLVKQLEEQRLRGQNEVMRLSLTRDLSLVLVVMMKSKELKTKIYYHAHSLILTHDLSHQLRELMM